ncbi:recombinase family protein [Streptomyces sp. URMC 129]|uniref:recombinase family protein n=1 Tax=Streptomyces sp. URMC 129 TaxID=3423407 RepID=UPI003F1AAF29
MKLLPIKGSESDADSEPFIAYIRVSTWKEEKISPELQRKSIAEWAKRNRKRIIDWVEDLDVSGRTFKRKITGVINRVEAGEARGVAVWRYSRFGRSPYGNVKNLARLEEAGGQLESATEHFDSKTAMGRFQRDLTMRLAALEGELIGETWTQTLQHRISLGLPPHGRPRFGYIWYPRRIPDGKGQFTVQDERYEPDPERDWAADDLYRRYVAGQGFGALAKWLNAQGLTNGVGNPWSAYAVAWYMDSGFAAGYIRVHNPECGCGDKVKCRNRILEEGAHQPILGGGDEQAAEELWTQYLARRAEVKRNPPRTRGEAAYILTALVKCGRCRGAYRIAQRDTSYCVRRETHGTTVCAAPNASKAALEAAAIDFLRAQAADIDALPAQRRAEAQRRADDLAERRTQRQAALTRQLDGAKRALVQLAINAAKRPDQFTPEVVEAARAELEQERDAAMAALADLEAETEQPTVTEYQPLIVGLLEEWGTLPVAVRNRILRRLLRRLVVDGGQVVAHPVWEPDPWAPAADGEGVRAS